MTIKTVLVSAFLFFSYPGVVFAQGSITVRDMMESCEAALDGQLESFVAGYCVGFMTGASIILTFNCSSKDLGFKPDPTLSMDAEGGAAGTAQAFVNWARDNPAKWSERFVEQMQPAIDGLLEEFPCR